MTLEKYLKRAKEKNPKADIKLLEKAFLSAKEWHKGQERVSGDDYFTHPLAVSLIVMDLGLDSETVSAALLHDVLEDTEITKAKMAAQFSGSICELVDGVTKLGEVDFDKYSVPGGPEADFDKKVESLRKLFLATAKDTRVVFVKLADRLHNMRTLAFLKEEDRKRIAKETLDIFVPLANRLGMGQMKAELEDLAFEYYMPSECAQVKALVQERILESKRYLPKIKLYLENTLQEESIHCDIDGRVKHVYGIYKKLKKYDGDLDKIYDIMAVRVIVESVEDCYKALGIIHAHFKPLIYKIKDYIALPKMNGYQSLHTTVFALDGRIIEIQIRTQAMHEAAENGVAAHWKYAESKEKIFAGNVLKSVNEQEIKVVEELKSFSLAEPSRLKSDSLFEDKIFAFSPQGDIYELSEGSTPVDFAYAVHSDIAEKCMGAKINGKMVTLDKKLENRDIVEIITSKKSSGPSRDWLYFAVTPRAKQKIRAYLRTKDRSQNILLGHEILEGELKILGEPKIEKIPKAIWEKALQAMPQKTKDDVLAGIGDGSLSAKKVTRKMFPPEKKNKPITLLLEVRDRKGLLSEITAVVSEMGINITNLETKLRSSKKRIYLTVSLNDALQERLLKTKLLKIRGLKSIKII